jgi:peptidoglycan/LPS O-acetylase OafA/YrhL
MRCGSVLVDAMTKPDLKNQAILEETARRPAPTSRIASLDGLRALSIAVVIIGHLTGTRNFPLRSLYLAALYADVAVRAFFVISGFLITTLLLREYAESGTIHLKEFYVRRAYRILPAAYAYMILVSAVFHASLSGKDIALAFTYLTSYSLYRPWILGHLWSLSVEEQFYFLWPAVMVMGPRIARRAAMATIALSPVLRIALTLLGISGTGSYFPAVADALATGCLLAILQPTLVRCSSFFSWRGFPVIWALTLSLPLLARPHARTFELVGLGTLHIGLALCIQNAIVARYRALNVKPMVWIGVLSYSLYLWQQVFLDRSSQAWYTAFPVNLVLAFLVAAISYYVIERPALHLRERRRPTRLPASSVEAH